MTTWGWFGLGFLAGGPAWASLTAFLIGQGLRREELKRRRILERGI